MQRADLVSLFAELRTRACVLNPAYRSKRTTAVPVSHSATKPQCPLRSAARPQPAEAKIVLGRLLDREVRGLAPSQDLVHVRGPSPIDVRQIFYWYWPVQSDSRNMRSGRISTPSALRGRGSKQTQR